MCRNRHRRATTATRPRLANDCAATGTVRRGDACAAPLDNGRDTRDSFDLTALPLSRRYARRETSPLHCACADSLSRSRSSLAATVSLRRCARRSSIASAGLPPTRPSPTRPAEMPRRAAAAEEHPTLSGHRLRQPARRARARRDGDHCGHHASDDAPIPRACTASMWTACRRAWRPSASSWPSMDSLGITPPVRQIGDSSRRIGAARSRHALHANRASRDLPRQRERGNGADDGRGAQCGHGCAAGRCARGRDVDGDEHRHQLADEAAQGGAHDRGSRAGTTGCADFRMASRCARRRGWARRRADGSTSRCRRAA